MLSFCCGANLKKLLSWLLLYYYCIKYTKMKHFLLLGFLFWAINANAQVKTDYDTLQDYRMERIQLHLEKFHKSFSTGSAMYLGGVALAGVGLASSKPNTVLIGIGGGLNFIGSIVMIAAHNEIRRASQVRRNKSVTQK